LRLEKDPNMHCSVRVFLTKVLYQAPCPMPVYLEVRVPGYGSPGHPCTPVHVRYTMLSAPCTRPVHCVIRCSSMVPGPGRPYLPGKRKCTLAPTALLVNRSCIIPPWKTVPCISLSKVGKFWSPPTYFPVPGAVTPFHPLFQLRHETEAFRKVRAII